MNSWIPLARVAREHGLTKGETSYLRCDLLQVGGLAFQFVKQIAFSSSNHGAELEKITLTEPVKPLGGKWGQAKAVIIPIHKTRKWTRGEWIFVPREAFPKLGDAEIYLCDLMGKSVGAEAGSSIATIIGIEDRSKGSTEAISLILRDVKSSKTFEVPLKAIDWTQTSQDLIVVPTYEDWSELA